MIPDAPALTAEGLAKGYGGIRALAPFTAAFRAGTVTAVVGPNGAGKTTLLDCLSGRTRADQGVVRLHGEPVSGLPPHARARRGLARLFQEGELFRTLTVREALALAFDLLGRRGTLVAALSPSLHGQRARLVGQALQRFNLEQVADEVLANLSLGMSRVVGLVSLQLSGADVWLLDEPASGLARAEVERMGTLLRGLATDGPGRCIVMVEHDAGIVRAAADRVLLLEQGTLVADVERDTPAWEEVLEGRSSVGQRAHTMGSPTPGAGIAGESPHLEQAATLGARALSVAYGKFVAVRDVDLEARTGDIRCLVGTNGAGKSTILRALAGLLTPSRGEVLLDGRPVTAPAHARVRDLGIVLVAGGRTVFPHLTVAENLRLTRSGPARADDLDLPGLFPELAERSRQLAGTLSGGEQQMLAIARALQLRPRFLLVDELTLGLAERAAGRLLEALWAARERLGLGVLLVEQDYALALRWSSHAYVLAQGEVIYDGPAAAALEQPGLFRPVFMPEAATR